MKQKNRMPMFPTKVLTMRQLLTLTGGDASAGNSGTIPPPVTAPGDTDAAAISNVLKTKHDTAKNSVGNIR